MNPIFTEQLAHGRIRDMQHTATRSRLARAARSTKRGKRTGK